MSALGAVPHYVEPVEGRRYKVIVGGTLAATFVRGPMCWAKPPGAWVQDGHVIAGGSTREGWAAEAIAAVELARDLEPVA